MGENPIKFGMITKRSQQKKSFGPVNYKERLFVLNSSKLSYYEGNEQAKGKIKGSISVDSITFVGPISDKALNRTSAFQIIHDGVILYCCAKNEADRNEWIVAIKQAVRMQHQGANMQMRFHPQIFSGGKWQCCGSSNKSDQGCESSEKINEEKYNKPLPKLPPEASNGEPYPNPSNGGFNDRIVSHISNDTFSHYSPQHPPTSLAASLEYFTKGSSSSRGNEWQHSNKQSVNQSVYHKSSQPTSSYQRRGTLPTMQNGVNLSEEPVVPSYPHYIGKKSDHLIPSKSYEHTAIQFVKPTPPVIPEESQKKQTVIAMYDFEPIERDDIELRANERYTVIDDSQLHWWRVQNSYGKQGYVPSNYLRDEQSDGIETNCWFQKEMSRQRAEYLLKEDRKEGTFIVRNSTQPSVIYTLSVLSKGGNLSGPFHVKHYHIKKNHEGLFYLSEKHPMPTVVEVIDYHKLNAGGLVTRLRNAPSCLQTDQSSCFFMRNSKWEIDLNELEMLQELGSGQFGCVKLALYRKRTYVAVKVMKENAMEEESFVEEAEVMARLVHSNLVSLHGVVTKQRPICIVTEFMEEGSLLDYIRKNAHLLLHPDTLLDICHQICSGMQYLESQNMIHRDLAARNCLVGRNMKVKVADFGLTRYVLDDEYTSSLGSKFPIKWAAPEVLNYTKFSSKSDVWAYGVLMWEVFSGGKMPFSTLTNTDVVDQVVQGLRLSKPRHCPDEVYAVMLETWQFDPDRRPSFHDLFDSFYNLIDRVSANCLSQPLYDA